MKTTTVHSSLLLVALTLLMGGAQELPLSRGLTTAVHAATAQQPSPSRPPQDDEFVPVKDLGNQEQLPAAPLVIGAYAVAWIAVFLYLWSIWRRLARVEHDIASLSRRVGQGARPGAQQ
jgi:CcmD family protein